MTKAKKDHICVEPIYLMAPQKCKKTLLSENSPPGVDKVTVRQYCLQEEIDTSDVTTSKNFFRIYIARIRGKIKEKPTSDSVNAFAE